MKKLILYALTAAIVFSAAAVVSWFLNPPPLASAMPSEAGSESHSEKKQEVIFHPAANHDASVSATVRHGEETRPSRSSATEEAVRLAASLRERLAAVQQRETQIENRQKQLDLVYQDIRLERVALESLQKQVSAELQLIQKKVRALEDAKQPSKDGTKEGARKK
jgi:hypothetical protein